MTDHPPNVLRTHIEVLFGRFRITATILGEKYNAIALGKNIIVATSAASLVPEPMPAVTTTTTTKIIIQKNDISSPPTSSMLRQSPPSSPQLLRKIWRGCPSYGPALAMSKGRVTADSSPPTCQPGSPLSRHDPRLAGLCEWHFGVAPVQPTQRVLKA